MKLRNRENDLKKDFKSFNIKDITDDDSSDGSDSESDGELSDLALKIGSIVTSKIDSSEKSQNEQPEQPLFIMDRTAGAGPSTSRDTVLENVQVEDDSEKSDSESDKEKSESDNEDSSDSEEESPTPKKTTKESRKSKKKQRRQGKKEQREVQLSSSLQVGFNMGDLYINTDPDNNPAACLRNNQSLKDAKSKIDNEILSKSVITADFEKKHQIPTYQESLHSMKKKRREEKGKTKGSKWFGMKAPEMTEEKKNNMMVLQWRRALDPKHFFKASDTKAVPKFFQLGKVVEDHADFYSGRIPKKQRKADLVQELLADAEFRNYNKRKYAEIVESKKQGKGAYRHMKRLKKRK